MMLLIEVVAAVAATISAVAGIVVLGLIVYDHWQRYWRKPELAFFIAGGKERKLRINEFYDLDVEIKNKGPVTAEDVLCIVRIPRHGLEIEPGPEWGASYFRDHIEISRVNPVTIHRRVTQHFLGTTIKGVQQGTYTLTIEAHGARVKASGQLAIIVD